MHSSYKTCILSLSSPSLSIKITIRSSGKWSGLINLAQAQVQPAQRLKPELRLSWTRTKICTRSPLCGNKSWTPIESTSLDRLRVFRATNISKRGVAALGEGKESKVTTKEKPKPSLHAQEVGAIAQEVQACCLKNLFTIAWLGIPFSKNNLDPFSFLDFSFSSVPINAHLYQYSHKA